MFKKAPNYFYKPTNNNNYGTVQTTYEWQTLTPPENLPKSTMQFLKTVKHYTKIKRNYQQEINKQIYYTPAQIEKYGIKLDPSTTANIYQQVDLNKMNATDVREASKAVVNEQINEMAIKETNQQIAKLKNEINQKQTKLNQLQQQKQPTQTTTTKGENN